MDKLNLPKIKELSKDVSLNLIAVVISTGTMQLLLYPLIAKQLGAEGYGTMLTIMGVVNVLALSFGNNLCNARIVRNPEYIRINKKGDFQIFLLLSIAFSTIIIGTVNTYFKQSTSTIIGVALATIFIIARSYYLVDYRIKIDYIKNLYANVVLSVGFIVGSVFLLNYLEWPYIFLLANLLCLVYIWYNGDIIKEPVKRTPLFKDSGIAVFMLIISAIVSNLTTYLDRFIVYPFLGGSGVSCYATASYFTKCSTLVILPMTSVLLTYLSADRIAINKHRFNVINILMLLFMLVFCFISVTVGEWITALLFPTLIEQASSYIFMASIGVIIGVGTAFCGTFVLAKAPAYWQAVIYGTKFVIYLLVCTFLVRDYGIMGLCVGVIITNTICYVFNYLVAMYYLNKKEFIN